MFFTKLKIRLTVLPKPWTTLFTSQPRRRRRRRHHCDSKIWADLRWKWREYDLWKCRELLIQRHSPTFEKTLMVSCSTVRTANLAKIKAVFWSIREPSWLRKWRQMTLSPSTGCSAHFFFMFVVVFVSVVLYVLHQYELVSSSTRRRAPSFWWMAGPLPAWLPLTALSNSYLLPDQQSVSALRLQ
jgi:hypothetical protein